ncbi:MAG: cell division protein ZapA [Treponema sp.]|jgi:cell division protein ZapA (FtsZ GTPase activity inhibitor)|nr:cell division protein ZapA [Treponema sp.]
MPRSDLRIDILGASFSIAADEEPAYLESLLNRYRTVVESTRRSTGIRDPLKTAILAGFLLCDEIQKLKSGKQQPLYESQEAERLTLELIARIDEALSAPDRGPEISGTP